MLGVLVCLTYIYIKDLTARYSVKNLTTKSLIVWKFSCINYIGAKRIFVTCSSIWISWIMSRHIKRSMKHQIMHDLFSKPAWSNMGQIWQVIGYSLGPHTVTFLAKVESGPDVLFLIQANIGGELGCNDKCSNIFCSLALLVKYLNVFILHLFINLFWRCNENL